MLLLHANETLSTDRLIDELWGEHPPATAAKTVQVHVVSPAQGAGGGAGNGAADAVVTREHGYELRLDPDRLDAHRFERLVAEGRSELAAGHPQRAAAALEAGALAVARPAACGARLRAVRAARDRPPGGSAGGALEELIEAKLALGRHGEVVGQLEALIAEHPYRERLRAQLMLALYRCERQADALQAYQDAARTLVEELGIEPGERLRELERAILAQDPALCRLGARRGTRPARSGPAETAHGGGHLPADGHRGFVGPVGGGSRGDGGGARAPRRPDRAHGRTHGGRLLKAKGEGDATLTVFRRSSDAVGLPLELQDAHGAARGPAGSTYACGSRCIPARRMSAPATTSAPRSTAPPG